MSLPEPPPGWRFDPFADARFGRSLFEMRGSDRLEPWPDDPRLKIVAVSPPAGGSMASGSFPAWPADVPVDTPRRIMRAAALASTMLQSPWIGQTQGPPKLKP